DHRRPWRSPLGDSEPDAWRHVPVCAAGHELSGRFSLGATRNQCPANAFLLLRLDQLLFGTVKIKVETTAWRQAVVHLPEVGLYPFGSSELSLGIPFVYHVLRPEIDGVVICHLS